LFIFLVLSVQTFSRANRSDGYDFKSYLLTSEALWEGDNPYQTGSPFPYIYPLFLAVILAPFAYIPYWLANLLFLLINIFGLVAIYVIMIKLLSKESISILNHIFPLLILCIVFINIIQNNLLNGQINIVVLLLSVLFLFFYLKDSIVFPSIFLAAAIAIKLTPLIFIFFLFKRKKYKVLILTSFFSFIFIFALPYLISGNKTMEYYQDYLNKINLLTNAQLFDRSLSAKIFTLNDFVSIIIPVTYNDIIVKNISALVVLITLWLIDKNKYINERKHQVLIFSIYSVSILLISPVSEVHHIIVLFPGLIILVNEFLLKENKFGKIQIILASSFLLTFILGTILKIGPFYFVTFSILIVILYGKYYEMQLSNKV
jgi:alpha-1,2-mannosyltransferase